MYFFDILIFKNNPKLRYFLILILKWASRYNDIFFFDVLISKSASNRLNFVYFIFEIYFVLRHRIFFYLARWYRTRRFSELIFRFIGAINYWKNIVVWFCFLFAYLYFLFFFSLIFFFLFSFSFWPFLSLLFFIFAFYLSIYRKFDF
jgi:hypothetical protein